LYQVVAEYLETFLDEVRTNYDKPLPNYVEKELREFLKCGQLPYGFLRAYCKIYRVKATRHGNETQRVMQPMQFMARLVALIPPPYHPLLRYFGVFAPHSSWRSSVIPELAEPAGKHSKHEHAHAAVPPTTASEQTPAPSALLQSGASDVAAAMVTVPAAPSEHGKSNWGDDDSEPPPSRPRWYIDWATLLRRVSDVDALACPCGGRLRFVALVTQEETARTMLQGMGLPAHPPPIARARSPAFDPDPLPNWD
jgi:hypothetical protein